MVKNSNIEWTDHTFNPWIGCQKVSPACKHCYAETQVNRFGGHFSAIRRITTDAYWKQPLRWNREAGLYKWGAERYGKTPRRPRVFCASLADVFEKWDGHIHDSQGEVVWHEAAGETLDMDAIRDRLFDLIRETPNLDWLLLTKRPENIRDMWPKFYDQHGDVIRYPMPNVWLGTTVENQEQADKRIPELLKCRDLSPVLFLSCEPLLGKVDLWQWLGCPEDEVIKDNPGSRLLEAGRLAFGLTPQIDWVIAGGESGSNARPMHPDWARSLRDQCKAAKIAFHFKQWGEYAPDCNVNFIEYRKRIDTYKLGKCSPDYCRFFKGDDLQEIGNGASGNDVTTMFKVGKKAAGRMLDNREWNELPTKHQVPSTKNAS